MGTIKELSPLLTNQIAAGEVIERPSSVVKELLENAIDAGSTRIEIEIEESGLRKIRIQDNGSGMTKEDARMSIKRHTTSKLYSPEQLFPCPKPSAAAQVPTNSNNSASFGKNASAPS